MKRYLIVIEPTQTGFSAYSPDLPGCVSTGGTRDEVEQSMREPLQFIWMDSAKKAKLCPSRTPTPRTSNCPPSATFHQN